MKKEEQNQKNNKRRAQLLGRILLSVHQFEIRLLLSGETDVAEAQIALVFEDADGKQSLRTLVHDGFVKERKCLS